ncbi:hypothetical protein H3N91_000240 [Salmonella enterica]|nr:hypothetical protein [Salmonella enterica]EEA2271423.1 hypothetical protein [Salmonella enterica]EFV5114828.1 hypothetical protein [Salmonella enterica]EGB7057528.1 hypothetical protein [Salmonella enterica]EKL9523984.1 hypothetical protein [Salmonella enterica]
MVISSILCRLIKRDDDGIPFLEPLLTELGFCESWYSPNEKVGLKGLWVHWRRMSFVGFDDEIPF